MIRELRTLVAVARRGSFAAAGEQVGLTQSAVRELQTQSSNQ